MLKNIGLFCKRDLQKRPIFCKETYIFKHPTNRSHPIGVPFSPRIYRFIQMYSHIYVHAYMYIYVYTYACMHIHVHLYVHTHTCLYICIHTYLYVHMYTYKYASTWLRNCRVSISAKNVYIYTHICKYIQLVPGKMRPEMVKEIQIEILNGGEILVN